LEQDVQLFYNTSRLSEVAITTDITLLQGSGIAQTGWTTERSEFKSRSRIFYLHVVQTGSGAHPASYPMGTTVFFSGGKAAEA
jgi:hypothetical protein